MNKALEKLATNYYTPLIEAAFAAMKRAWTTPQYGKDDNDLRRDISARSGNRSRMEDD